MTYHRITFNKYGLIVSLSSIIIVSVVCLAISKGFHMTLMAPYIPPHSVTQTLNVNEIANSCPSIIISKVEYIEYEKTVELPEKAAKISGKQSETFRLRDYSITFKNASSLPLAALVFSEYQNSSTKQKSATSIFYKQAQSILPNEERTEYIRKVQADRKIFIETALFDDNSVEGKDETYGKLLSKRWEGAKEEYVKLAGRLAEITRLSDDNLLPEIQAFKRMLPSEVKSSPGKIRAKSVDDFTNVGKEMGNNDCVNEINNILNIMEQYINRKNYDQARLYLQSGLNALDTKYKK